MRIAGFLLGACLALLLAGAPTPARAQSTRQLRAEAFRLYETGSYREALPLFNSVLERWTKDLEAHTRRGEIYLRLNQPLEAVADFDAALRINPLHPSTLASRGIARVMLGLYDEALRDFNRALSLYRAFLNPNVAGQAAAHCGIGQAYHRMGREDEAFTHYDTAVRLNPQDPNGFVGRGIVSAARDDRDRALADLDEAIRLDPNHSRAFANRADLLARRGEVDRALADYDRAIGIDSRYVQAYRLRGALLSRIGRNEKALADVEAVLRLDPKDAGALKDRGGILVRMGQFESAVRSLNDSIRIDPRRATAFLNRGAAYNSLGEFALALQDLNEAVRLDPRNAGAHTNCGLAHLAFGQFEEALGELTLAIELEPRNALAHYNRAGAYAHLNLFEEAVRDYDATIVVAPEFAPAYGGLAKALDSLGKSEKAIEEYGMALRLTPLDANLYTDRGNARRARGDWQGAIADFNRAVELRPKHAEHYISRGWSLLIANRDGADKDARSYLSLVRGDDKYAPHMAILGALGARRVGREHEARAFLDEAIANTPPNAWPAPLLRCLRRTCSEPALLEAAADEGERTEAHVFLGVDRFYSGDRAGAIEHLRWVRDHGVKRFVALDLAGETLRGLEDSSASAPSP